MEKQLPSKESSIGSNPIQGTEEFQYEITSP